MSTYQYISDSWKKNRHIFFSLKEYCKYFITKIRYIEFKNFQLKKNSESTARARFHCHTLHFLPARNRDVKHYMEQHRRPNATILEGTQRSHASVFVTVSGNRIEERRHIFHSFRDVLYGTTFHYRRALTHTTIYDEKKKKKDCWTEALIVQWERKKNGEFFYV